MPKGAKGDGLKWQIVKKARPFWQFDARVWGGRCMPYIKFENVVKEYKMGEVSIKALDNTNFEIEKGNLLLLLDQVELVNYRIKHIGRNGQCYFRYSFNWWKDISNFKPKQLIKYRREDIGFVFQFYNLVQNLTAVENVELATQICKRPLDPKTILKKLDYKIEWIIFHLNYLEESNKELQ